VLNCNNKLFYNLQLFTSTNRNKTESYILTRHKLTNNTNHNTGSRQPLPVIRSPHRIIGVSEKHLLDRRPICWSTKNRNGILKFPNQTSLTSIIYTGVRVAPWGIEPTVFPIGRPTERKKISGREIQTTVLKGNLR